MFMHIQYEDGHVNACNMNGRHNDMHAVYNFIRAVDRRFKIGQTSLISRHLSIQRYRPVDTQCPSVTSHLLYNDLLTITCTSRKSSSLQINAYKCNLKLAYNELYEKCRVKRLDSTHMQQSLTPNFIT